MADRQLISDELLQLRYGNDPVMEKIRIAREQRERRSGQKPPKAGPFHNAQYGVDLKKIALQSGNLTPGQVGLTVDEKQDHLKLNDKQPGEQTMFEAKMVQEEKKNKGIPQQGRPINSKDKTKRKEKTFSPKTKAALLIWAKQAQDTIAEVINEQILQIYKKKNMRSLSHVEAKTAEDLRFSVLYNLEPFISLTSENIIGAVKDDNFSNVKDRYVSFMNNVRAELGRELTTEEIRDLQTNFYVNKIIYGEKNVNN
jgi:hypothetical protein